MTISPLLALVSVKTNRVVKVNLQMLGLTPKKG